MPRIACLLVLLCVSPLAARPARVETGDFRFAPLDDQKAVPHRYRLAPRSFTYEMEKKTDLPSIETSVYRLRFPSPYTSPTPQNNTVHAEYYRPDGKGPYPAVIILDVTAGKQILSRQMAAFLAQNRVAGLFVQMAYYGPRRPAGSRLRLLSPNLTRTTAAITQTVLDLRVAAAWLAARPEILAASRDDIVPPSMARMLWEASGKQKIVWYDATHYGAVLHIADGLEQILDHFKAP
jgi:hypothetical protein